MPRPPVSKTPAKMFETRSQSWQEAGLQGQIDRGTARRARWEAVLLVPLFLAVVILYENRVALLGGSDNHLESSAESAVKWFTVIVLMILGWAIARDLGRAIGPFLFRRMEPGTAGTVGFVVRVLTILVALLVALAIAGLSIGQLVGVVGVTAVVLGLAAQQTLGNFIAGTVLISARPYRVGERVRLQGGMVAGQIEGVVSSLGLLYTTFATGEDTIMVPNSVVLSVAVRPLREPDAVTLRARLAPGMTPGDLQEALESSLATSLRTSPRITLEELEAGQAVVQISATPRRASDGRQLASELLELVTRHTGESSGGAAEGRSSADENGVRDTDGGEGAGDDSATSARFSPPPGT